MKVNPPAIIRSVCTWFGAEFPVAYPLFRGRRVKCFPPDNTLRVGDLSGLSEILKQDNLWQCCIGHWTGIGRSESPLKVSQCDDVTASQGCHTEDKFLTTTTCDRKTVTE